MDFVRKYIYIFHFLSLFLILLIRDYFKYGNWDLFSNFFFSLRAVIIFAFLDWAWDFTVL
ncbi:hypothetical protein [Lysinibacillus pakistanensis]|uniref:Uncharacterized protein n=1 Tax=Lysinibacillus pakistanensis TaxID=759811 RepID=A0AAX3X0W9_9BACI|nr:hypothetical protein [Lysinibacillus pakistanensis]MDM5233177.1 hypothetical protein [Lysinibacillus pakistanensis]WHY48656.1 hypothetical protein QNH22_10690 [Lysinibacillus pakistanensis]WHY53670.1 hypothetical protein QNH24_10675 [Lysinibacillus pakistanensis]